MKIFDLKNGCEVPSLCGCETVVALGNFDGVHLGHAALLKAAVNGRSSRGGSCKAAVYSFLTHPHSDSTPCLTVMEEKLDRFAAADIDYAVFEDFDAVRDMPPESFIGEVLVSRFHCVCAVCGFNFRFGAGGVGNPETLKQGMKKHGGETVIVPPVIHNNRIISSTAVRLLIENGKTEEAAELLGRPFSINFPVIYGRQFGRKIGIPTINQRFPAGHIIPQNGVYACTCHIERDDIFLGVSNVGFRPTFNSNASDVLCETHIIKYNGFLYGKNIRIDFYKKLRDEIKFDDILKLRQTAENDIRHATEYFSHM